MQLFLRDVRKLTLPPLSGCGGEASAHTAAALSQKNTGPDRNSRVKGEGNVQVYICVCVRVGCWPERGRKQRLEGLRLPQGADLLPESPEAHFIP